MPQQNTIYDGQFRGNVLVSRKIGCVKTYFLQKLAVNIFFLENCKSKMGIVYSIEQK